MALLPVNECFNIAIIIIRYYDRPPDKTTGLWALLCVYWTRGGGARNQLWVVSCQEGTDHRVEHTNVNIVL